MKRSVSILLLSAAMIWGGDSPLAPARPPQDDRLQADLLLVAAHPDDDSLIAGYLAKAVLDDHRRVAVVYATNGPEAGATNAHSVEAGGSLALLRMSEGRSALRSIGIESVWFLSGRDTPGQNVLYALENWDHGKVLGELVRIVRLTRPKVILTFLPEHVAGENHADHQAAGVLATEAFDAAGDPLQFPEQVSVPYEMAGMIGHVENLQPWQPQKLYFFSDAFEQFCAYWHDPGSASPFRPNFLTGHGPSFSPLAVSPSKHVSYARITAEEQSFYLSQGGQHAKDALAKNDFQDFEYATEFIFGKSVTGGSPTGDPFESVVAGPVPFVRAPGFQAARREGISVEIGGPWRFYREFWKAHGLAHLADLIPTPEVAIDFGVILHVPLVITNATTTAAEVTVTAALPTGWVEKTRYARYRVPPMSSHEFTALALVPAAGSVAWQQLTWSAEAAERQIGSATIRVYAGHGGGLPQ